MSADSFIVDAIAAIVKRIRNRPKAVARREAKQRQREAAAAAGGEFFPPDEDFMSDAQLSFLRGVLKWISGALAAKGLIDIGDAAALQVAIESLVAGGVGIYAFWLSHRHHTAA